MQERVREMNEAIQDFLTTELIKEETYQQIFNFITDFHIRTGEYEGCGYIIKKYNRDNFIIFEEVDIQKNKLPQIYNAMSFSEKEILKIIMNYAKSKGYRVNERIMKAVT